MIREESARGMERISCVSDGDRMAVETTCADAILSGVA